MTESLGARTDTHRYLESWRLHRGLTLREVAERAGCSWQSISAYENGVRRVNLDALAKMAKAYNTEPYMLLLPPRT
jgi:transcriptional regulator with XRE-family HTH domain